MSRVIILGAGLSGVLAAYETAGQIREDDELFVVAKGPDYQFVPSNPWVGVDWPKREDIEFDLTPIMARKNISFEPCGAKRVRPGDNLVDLENGSSIAYDYLVIATGPELAFDEIEGLGPDGFTQSVCHVDHASVAHDAFERLAAAPGPVVVGVVQGASCFGPAHEFAMILDTELRHRWVRDRVAMTFVTSEPYIGHLGLDGVGDTKSLFESEMRNRHIKWITNARVARVEDGRMTVEEVGKDGAVETTQQLDFTFSMLLPAFRGVAAVRDNEGLTNPRGFIIVDEHQRNPTYPNVFAIGVCVAIAPVGPTPVPVGVPKTGFMIETMVSVTAQNIGKLLRGSEADLEATWNTVCLADFGDGGVAFVAQPQIPPRNVNWSSEGICVHHATKAYETYFLRKIRRGESEPFYERWILEALSIRRIKSTGDAETIAQH